MDTFKEGMILRIYCENFLTYNNVECRPCAKLNVIIGPNGTGKSSLVNAIVLGLGGKTDIIGRAKSLSAFVKRGCETAKIEIELYSEPRNYVIGHIFNLENKSCWTVNGESTTRKQAELGLTSPLQHSTWGPTALRALRSVAYSTWKSQMVAYPRTNHAQRCLTSVIGRYEEARLPKDVLK